MEYLNARGLTLYGLEVSYFAGEIEAFVPRIVVRPTVGTRIAGRDSQAASKTAVDPETYLAELPEAAVDPVSEFLAHAPGLGAELEWVHYVPRVRVHGPAGPRVVAAIEGENAYLKTGPLQGIDPGPAARALERLQSVPGVSAKPGGSFPSLNIGKASPESLEAFFAIARDFIAELTGRDAV
jgi:hypothetical protein